MGVSLREAGEWEIQKLGTLHHCLGAPQPGVQDVLCIPEHPPDLPEGLIIPTDDLGSVTGLLVQIPNSVTFFPPFGGMAKP